MNILVVNCGSSSLKFQLIDSETEQVSASGNCERIGLDGKITYKAHGDKFVTETDLPEHGIAIKKVLELLVDKERGVINSLDEIHAVGHRMVHGGEKFSSSVVITEDVIKDIESCNDLAPLHNPANILGVRACQEAMPGVKHVAVFDTAFHQTMPAKAYLYGLPKEYYEKYGVRRYGFHGTSHSFVSKETIKFANLDPKTAKVIVCHLGNGASISASIGGKCVDTSMGLTPLEGLIMGTRSGDLDPAIIEYLCNHENLTVSEMLNILNKKSGVLGMSGGISSDFRDLNAAANEGNEVAKVTLEAYAYRVAKYIGSYTAAMNGVDAITFTAGVGENAAWLRPMVCKYLGFLGVKLDEEASEKACGVEGIISTPDSKVKLCVIPTNEELAIARETLALTK